MKQVLFFLIIGLPFLGACNPEKRSLKTESAKSKEVTSGELKLADGKTVYEANCAGCHDSGVAGAPKPGDKAAWSGRISEGVPLMAKKSIEGFEGKSGMMPPKGSNESLSNEDMMYAVTYMVSTVK
ncbi:MAG: c-type cytochrome [Chlorobiaceae bacterium]